MTTPIRDWEIDVVHAIYKRGGKLADDLRAKCKWEHMTPVAVLRQWPSFQDRWVKSLVKDEIKKLNKNTENHLDPQR